MRLHRTGLVALVALLLLAAGLRFYRLDAQSFWNDEGNSARLSERDFARIIEGTASDIHPPLYYLALRGWRVLLGDHEFGLRAFSVSAGVLTVAGTFALARLLLGGTAVPLIATFLGAVNPVLIYYSQETRMYALLGLLAALSTLFLLRWLRAGRGWGWALAYVAAAAAGMYTHYFFPAVLLVHGLIVGLDGMRRWREKRPLRLLLGWLGMLIAVGLAYLPWLPIFLRQTGGRGGERGPLLEFVWQARRWLAFGETVAPDALLWPTLALSGLLLLALLAGRRVLVPLLGTLMTVLFMYLSGATDPAFFKFLLAAEPFFLIWMALGVVGWLPALAARRTLTLATGAAAAVMVILLLGGTAVSLRNLYFNPEFARDDYRGIAARIAEEAHPNAGIILNAPNQWEVFTYYHRDGAPVYPLPKGQPDPAIVEPELAQIAARHDRLFVLFWGETQRDPQRVVERWLDANAFKASDQWVGDVRVVVYAVPDAPAQEMETAVDAQFGSDITLRGYTLGPTMLQPGDIVQVTLFWETAVPLDARYKVFLHLLDANGQLVAQRDSEPGGGIVPTTDWVPGEQVSDNHGILLPAALPPGDYQLVMGLYDLADPGSRLPIALDGLLSDVLPLAEITVR